MQLPFCQDTSACDNFIKELSEVRHVDSNLGKLQQNDNLILVLPAIICICTELLTKIGH